jgi:hypothetical protein
MKDKYTIKRIERKDCEHMIIDIHYARRWPSISYAYGLFVGDELVGCVTYGSPASPWLCKGVCGEEYRLQVLELNRLVLINNNKNEASYLVGNTLKILGMERDAIVVSYADTAHGHTGYVYQATNFLFTGTTKPRTDMAAKDGKHSRHHQGDRSKRVHRSAKHRYVAFIGNKRFKKSASSSLRYPVSEYPKLMS